MIKHMAYIFITLLVLSFSFLAAGCGGGGATGGALPGPLPTIAPTANPQPTPDNPLPDGKGALLFCSDWASTLFELHQLPIGNDGFGYKEVQGGDDKIYEPDFFGYTHTSDNDGDFSIYVDPGTYSIFQVVDNNTTQEKYFLGNFTIVEGEYTDYCVDSSKLTTVIIRVRFEFPTSYAEVSDFIGMVGVLLNTDTDVSNKMFSSLEDNYEKKEYVFKAKMLAGPYQFDCKGVGLSGVGMALNPQYIWDISGGVFEKKILICNLSPAGDATVFKPTDPTILVGSNTVADAGYQMLTTNPAGELIISSYDDGAGTSLAEKIAIYKQFNDPVWYTAFCKIASSMVSPPVNSKIINFQIFSKYGVKCWYNVIGQDISGKYLTVSLHFQGEPEIGMKADGYPEMVDIGVGDVYIQRTGNLNSVIVDTYPVRPRLDELEN